MLELLEIFLFLVIEIVIKKLELLEIFLFFSYRNSYKNVSYIYRNVIIFFCFLVIEILEML